MNQELSNCFSSEPPWIMGVLNVTPNSFSDGGLFEDDDSAIAHGSMLANDGAHIIDVGGESTGPGTSGIGSAQELDRVANVVAGLAQNNFVSVDTFRAETARRCLELGAKMINDVSAGRADDEMLSLVGTSDAFIVLMYSKQPSSHPHASSEPVEYDDVIEAIREFLSRRIDAALSAGISEDKIVLDPGMGGFISPNPKYSWEVLERFAEFDFPFPMLIGTSRKGFLGGEIKERDPISQENRSSSSFKRSVNRPHPQC